jgi:hypothetical protein
MRDPTEYKDGDIKDRSYEELENVFHQFPRYHMKSLPYFNANIEKGHY